jgi:hypothetical protein
MPNRILSLFATILAASLIAACGGGDGGESEGGSGGGGGSDPTVAATGNGDGDTTEVASDDGALTLQIPAGTDGASDITATAIEGGWELAPDGATFDEPLIVEFAVPSNGGLPVAFLTSSDGSTELPAQHVRIADGQAHFTVAISHFSELTSTELNRSPSDTDPSTVLPLVDSDRALDVPSAELAEVLRELEASTDAAVARLGDLANRRWFSDPPSDLPDDFEDGWVHTAYTSDGKIALFQPDDGAPGDSTESGSGGADTGGRDFVAFPSGGFAIDDAEDISDAVSVAVLEDGYLFRLQIPETANHEATVADGGRFQVAVTWGTLETVIESTASTDEDAEPNVIVRSRGGFSEIERQGTAAESRIEGDHAIIFFPAQVFDGELAVFVNDSIYSGVDGIDVGAWSRDENGENLWVGATGADVTAFANLAP